MTEKRYQVFVSSTYSDLKEERGKVMQSIMSLDCIPAGMELFPAIDTEQFEFIKRVIDDCDYYILIIGGRYGSISEDGISFTEKEYDYAISKGIPVLAFLHKNINQLIFEKSESQPENRKKLESFRDKVSKGRLVKYWNNADELSQNVVISLTKTMKIYPAVGWIRANLQTNTESLQEINSLRKEIDKLKKEKIRLENKLNEQVPDIADLDETIEITGKHCKEWYNEKTWSHVFTWNEIFTAIAFSFWNENMHDYKAQDKIGRILYSLIFKNKNSFIFQKISDESFYKIKVQLIALGLMTIRNDIWKLSKKGEQIMLKTEAIKTAKNK